MINIIILGATGSIGSQAIDVIRSSIDLRLVAISFNNNYQKAQSIVDEFGMIKVYSPNHESLQQINNAILCHEIDELKTDDAIIINAVSGSDGLFSTLWALENTNSLLLANKESLVMAGCFVMAKAKEYQTTIIPIDSEHSALYQLLKIMPNVKKVYITASGGALRDYSRSLLRKITKVEALNHPTWQMGNKITIDSATMMNKAFELVEASFLFDLDSSKIKALIDKNSKIHAMVMNNENQVLPHLAKNDMHLPIAYALGVIDDYNVIKTTCTFKELKKNYQLKTINKRRYPFIALGKKMIDDGRFMGTIVTVLNDILVKKFLNDEINLIEMEKSLFQNLKKYQKRFKKLDYSLTNIIKIKEIIEKEVY